MNKLTLIALAACAALSSCRSVVSLSSDGSLTENSLILISPDYDGMAGKPHTPAPPCAFHARTGYSGSVDFTVRRTQAHDTFRITLVPDQRSGGKEFAEKFIPARTKAIVFSQEGIRLTPRRKK